MSIREFLGLEKKKGSAGDTETVRKIVEKLDRMEPERARYIAAFAFLLSRVARADLHISEEETRAMEQLVVEHGESPQESKRLSCSIVCLPSRPRTSLSPARKTRPFVRSPTSSGSITTTS